MQKVFAYKGNKSLFKTFSLALAAFLAALADEKLTFNEDLEFEPITDTKTPALGSLDFAIIQISEKNPEPQKMAIRKLIDKNPDLSSLAISENKLLVGKFGQKERDFADLFEKIKAKYAPQPAPKEEPKDEPAPPAEKRGKKEKEKEV